MHDFSSPDIDVLRLAGVAAVLAIFGGLVARVPLQQETKRRIQHASSIHAMVQVSYYLNRWLAFSLLVMAALVLYILQKRFPDHFQRSLGAVLRKNELNGQLTGAFWTLVGVAMAIATVDDLTICRYATECSALADPMASWIGSTIPSFKVNARSSLAGCVACFITAFGVGAIMLPTETALSTLCLGAFACTLAEASSIGNDNVNVPIVVAWTVYSLQ